MDSRTFFMSFLAVLFVALASISVSMAMQPSAEVTNPTLNEPLNDQQAQDDQDGCSGGNNGSCIGLPPIPAEPAAATRSADTTARQPAPAQTGIGWLDHLNDRRARANLPPVSNNPEWTEGCELHSRYMVKNDYIGHSEDSSNQWYSEAGALAASKGNVAVHSDINNPDENFIDGWMEGPFHAIGIIDPRLLQAAYGVYREQTGMYRSAATLDVMRGQGAIPETVSYPIMFPAEGQVMPIKAFTGYETPDPLTSCPGYTAPTGPPLMIQFAQDPVVSSYSVSKDGMTLEACSFDETNYTNSNGSMQRLGRQVLGSRNAVVIMPKEPLTDGTYTVSITTNGETHTWSFLVGEDSQIGEPTATSTATPTDIAPPTATPTPLPTATPTATPSPTPLSEPDVYEEDDSCQNAQPLTTDGTVQQHSFHDAGDSDWVSIATEEDTHYLIEAQVPAGSRANVAMDMYTTCDAVYDSPYTNYTSTLGLRLQFRAPVSGTMRLKLAQEDPSVFGGDVNYHFSVRELPADNLDNALIIVGDSDPNQQTINKTAAMIDQVFTDQGNYITNNFQRFYAPHTDVYSGPLTLKIQSAITEWANEQIGNNGMLTLYLVGHGQQGAMVVDSSSDQQVTAADLNGWLSTLETERPDITIVIVVDSTYAGSFLSDLSKTGTRRVIILSTGATNAAWVGIDGTLFSRYFLQALGQGGSFASAFTDAQMGVQAAAPWRTPSAGLLLQNQATLQQAADPEQTPLLEDSNGLARQYGIVSAQTDTNQPQPPAVREVFAPTVDDGAGSIKALIEKDERVDTVNVQAKVYGPAYQASGSNGELIEESNVQTVDMALTQNGVYAGDYTFTSAGAYRVVVYAEDGNGLQAQPQSIQFMVQSSDLAITPVYLPMIQRSQ